MGNDNINRVAINKKRSMTKKEKWLLAGAIIIAAPLSLLIGVVFAIAFLQLFTCSPRLTSSFWCPDGYDPFVGLSALAFGIPVYIWIIILAAGEVALIVSFRKLRKKLSDR